MLSLGTGPDRTGQQRRPSLLEWRRSPLPDGAERGTVRVPYPRLCELELEVSLQDVFGNQGP